MKHLKFALLALAIIAFASPGFSQEDDGTTTTIVSRDFELWTGVGIKAKFGDFSIELEEQFRFEENAGVTDQYFTNIGLGYKFHKRFSMGADFRHIKRPGDETRNRISFDATYNHKLMDRLRLSYRIRWQNRNDVGYTEEDGDYPLKTWRLRLKADYNIKGWKLDPYFSTEIFRQNSDITTPTYSNLRFTFGTSYKFKDFRISGFYRVERELGVTYPQTTYIVGVGLRYNLKFSKK